MDSPELGLSQKGHGPDPDERCDALRWRRFMQPEAIRGKIRRGRSSRPEAAACSDRATKPSRIRADHLMVDRRAGSQCGDCGGPDPARWRLPVSPHRSLLRQGYVVPPGLASRVIEVFEGAACLA